MFKITFYDPRTSMRHTYMSIGFETYESADRELSCIKRNKKKFLKHNEIYLYDPVYLLSFQIGQRWKIEPIKLLNGK